MKCIVLKRLLLLAAMAAMVLALALPALANGTNTGNAQNQIDLLQYGSGAGGFEFDEVSSDIAVGGTNETTCDQQVNQAASASGGG